MPQKKFSLVDAIAAGIKTRETVIEMLKADAKMLVNALEEANKKRPAIVLALQEPVLDAKLTALLSKYGAAKPTVKPVPDLTAQIEEATRLLEWLDAIIGVAETGVAPVTESAPAMTGKTIIATKELERLQRQAASRSSTQNDGGQYAAIMVQLEGIARDALGWDVNAEHPLVVENLLRHLRELAESPDSTPGARRALDAWKAYAFMRLGFKNDADAIAHGIRAAKDGRRVESFALREALEAADKSATTAKPSAPPASSAAPKPVAPPPPPPAKKKVYEGEYVQLSETGMIVLCGCDEELDVKYEMAGRTVEHGDHMVHLPKKPNGNSDVTRRKTVQRQGSMALLRDTPVNEPSAKTHDFQIVFVAPCVTDETFMMKVGDTQPLSIEVTVDGNPLKDDDFEATFAGSGVLTVVQKKGNTATVTANKAGTGKVTVEVYIFDLDVTEPAELGIGVVAEEKKVTKPAPAKLPVPPPPTAKAAKPKVAVKFVGWLDEKAMAKADGAYDCAVEGINPKDGKPTRWNVSYNEFVERNGVVEFKDFIMELDLDTVPEEVEEDPAPKKAGTHRDEASEEEEFAA